jgi:glycosyltransferase involved in cell wall biosynthesis
MLAAVFRRSRPHVVLSFEHYTNCVTILAAHLAGVQRVCVSERIVLSWWLTQLRYATLRRRLVRWLYPKASGLIAVSEAVRQDLIQRFGIPGERIQVIPNPVDTSRLQMLAQVPVDDPWFQEAIPVILGAGRLAVQKDYPTLLRAFALVRQHHVVRLAILGDGELRDALEQDVHRLGLDRDVAFLGFDPNPYRYLRRAAVFVLTSRYEGLPNVLLEAMTLGIPVISTHYNVPAPHEVIMDGENGLVVPCGDVDRLAAAMTRLLTEPTLRDRLAHTASAQLARFQADRIVRAYEELFLRKDTDSESRCQRRRPDTTSSAASGRHKRPTVLSKNHAA